MLSIACLSGAFVPELFELRPDIVNSGSRGRIQGRNRFSYLGES
jgi:hypothetical protein